MYLAKENDIHVSLSPDRLVRLSDRDKKLIEDFLVGLYVNGSCVNLRRSFATCPKCKDYITYIDPGSGEETRMSACTLIYTVGSENILIPVQVLHFLTYHQDCVDENILQILGRPK